MFSVKCYRIYWRYDEVEEFSRLKYALDARFEYMDCTGDEHAPNIIAVLNDGKEVVLR